MSFSFFSFNPTSVKNNSIKYFENRSTEMYILRYRCPNNDVFDPLTHLTGLKSVFLTPDRETLLDSNQYKKDIADNVLNEDLLSLSITDQKEENKNSNTKKKQNDTNTNKNVQNQRNERDSNILFNRHNRNLFDETAQNDKYLINNSKDTIKLIFRFIKEKNYVEAFESINKLISINSKIELVKPSKACRDASNAILYLAFIGLFLGYSIHNEEKQYEFLDIISEYPIYDSDLPHFYHLIDEILLANNGIRQFTLAHLLGFPTQFFLPININNQIKNGYRSKRSKNRSRSSNQKNDYVFNHIINRKFRLNPNEHDYDDDDDINDDYDNDYDYYDFDSDSENEFDDDFESYDDFDYDFLKNKHFHLHGIGSEIDKRAIDEMPPDIKREFFRKTFRLNEKKKLLDMKLKRRMLKEELNSSKKSFESSKIHNEKERKGANANNRNDNDINEMNDSSQWKVIGNNTKNTNNTLFGKSSSDDIQITPILNVVFPESPKYPVYPMKDQYYYYRAYNSSQIVNCNFISESLISNYAVFDDEEYNYCCLPHFIQSYMPKKVREDQMVKLFPNYKNFLTKDRCISKYNNMTEAKETIKSLSDCSTFKTPLPILTCSIQTDDENDESLAAEIEAAIAKPSLFSSKQNSKPKLFLKKPHERIDELMENFRPPPDFIRSKPKSSISDSISSIGPAFIPSFGSDDDDFEDDGNFPIFNSMFNSDPNSFPILSQINPLFSSLKNCGNQKTTTEIKKMGNGTTIAKITTTKITNGNFFSDDDMAVNTQSPRSSKDKKKKPRRDGK